MASLPGATVVDCPFCGGQVDLVEQPVMLVHTLPPCRQFIEIDDPLDFLKAATLAAEQLQRLARPVARG